VISLIEDQERWVSLPAALAASGSADADLSAAASDVLAFLRGGDAVRDAAREVLARLGLIPGAGGTQRLPRLVGRGRALELLLGGGEVGGEEAYAPQSAVGSAAGVWSSSICAAGRAGPPSLASAAGLLAGGSCAASARSTRAVERDEDSPLREPSLPVGLGQGEERARCGTVGPTDLRRRCERSIVIIDCAHCRDVNDHLKLVNEEQNEVVGKISGERWL
jgi:hypothetical protein